jgi:hypothetical protein
MSFSFRISPSQNAVCGYLNFSAETSLMELAAGLVSAVHYCTAGDQGVPHHTHMPVSRLFEELFKLREEGGRSVKNFLVLLNCFASNMVIFCQLDRCRKVSSPLCSLGSLLYCSAFNVLCKKKTGLQIFFQLMLPRIYF